MSQTIMQPLIGKILIKGAITVKTGLAIGGNKSGIDIGALDNPVIKYRKFGAGEEGMPYIPGSSLKGKMRALLAKVAGSKNIDSDRTLTGDFKHLAAVFGYPPDRNEREEIRGEALLKVRDCFLNSEPHSEAGSSFSSERSMTEEKMENQINRVSGKANPRPLERVIPGVSFAMDLCLDVYNEKEAQEHLDLIGLAISLLNFDYLGGGGSRGNGRIDIEWKELKYLKVIKPDLILRQDEHHPFKSPVITRNESTADVNTGDILADN